MLPGLSTLVLSHTPACRSYNEWKQEKEHGTTATDASAAGSSSATSGSSAGDAVRGAAQEAADTARSAKDVVKMEGQAAGRSCLSRAVAFTFVATQV